MIKKHAEKQTKKLRWVAPVLVSLSSASGVDIVLVAGCGGGSGATGNCANAGNLATGDCQPTGNGYGNGVIIS